MYYFCFMLYVSDCEDFKQFEFYGKIYNFRQYNAIPEEFAEAVIFEPTKIKSLYTWQEPFFRCLSCGQILKQLLARKHQNLPAGGFVELELYRCSKCGKIIILEMFDND